MSLLTTALRVPEQERPALATKVVSREHPHYHPNPMDWDCAWLEISPAPEAKAIRQEKSECNGVWQKLPGLDEIIIHVRESPYICTVFVVVLMCTTVLAVVLLVDPDPEYSDVFAGLFGVFALLQVILGALLQVRNDNTDDIVSYFEFITKDNNGVRAFMVLEALVDIAVGALSLSKPVVVPVASAAITLASAAIAVLVLVPLCYNDEDSKESFVYGYHMPIAIVLTDSADVLLLLRAVTLQSIQAKDVLLFVFLILNVVVTELSTLIAIRAEENAPIPQEELDEKDDEKRRKLLKARLQKAIKMRKSMRNKSLAQTVVTATLIIPMMLAIILADFLDSKAELALILLPVVSFFFRVSESKAFCGPWLLTARLNDAWRDLLPRLYVLTCAFVLAANDAALSLSHEVQQTVFYAYAIYNAVPFVLRVVEYWTQHQVNIIANRPYNVQDRETDTYKSKLWRSALADAIDNSNYLISKEGLEKQARWDPSVAFAMYCKCEGAESDNETDDDGVESDDDADEATLGCRSRFRNKWKTCMNLIRKEKEERGITRDFWTLKTWSQHLAIEGTDVPEVVLSAKACQSTELSLNGNKIRITGAEHLAEALKVNATLQKLHLSHNYIKDKGVQAIGQALAENKSSALTKIDLKSNKISDAGAQALGDMLRINKTLTELELWCNEIGDAGAKALGDGLKENTSLTKLSLESNRISDIGAEGLARGLKKNGTLTVLSLVRNKISDAGAAALGDGLKENETLTELNLSFNKIADDGALALGDGLRKNQFLTHLDLSGYKLPVQALKGGQQTIDLNAIGWRLKNVDAIIIALLIAENESLTTLNLHQNEIGSDGAIVIGEALKVNKKLRILCLSGTKLPVQPLKGGQQTIDLSAKRLKNVDANVIACLIAENETLTTLDLQQNEIGRDGAMALGHGLTRNQSLTKLDLHQNEIDSVGAMFIGEGLKMNKKLQKLYLHGNRIGDIGAQAIGEGLAVNGTLQILALNFNKIGDDGASALGDGLKENETLKLLILSQNRIGDIGAKALGEGLADNTALHHLELGSDEISEGFKRALQRSDKRIEF